MNKNKIIFAIIGVLVLGAIFWGISLLNSSGNTTKRPRLSTEDFKIWTYNLDKAKLDEIVKDFKKTNTAYENKNITVENFSDYKDYEDSLLASIVQGKAPDVFLLNNFEKSYLENQTAGINPTLINPNDFRKNYKTFFGDDLISKTSDGSGQTIDFVTGVPVGYETLGIFYNKRFGIKSTDLESWAGVSTVVNIIKERNPDIIPLGMGNGSTVNDSQDIITQFFMLSGDSGVNSFDQVTDVGLKEAFSTYYSYADEKDPNAYDTKYNEMKKDGKTNLELFSAGDLAMIIGYPSMIDKINGSGFNKSFLFAEPFPHYFSSKGKTLVRYSYFVVNKDTKDETLAFDFLKYLSDEKGARNFLSKFTYLLPALVTLEQDKLGERIHDSYNVVLGDFYKEGDDGLFSSFDKGITSYYDTEMVKILDNTMTYIEEVKKLQKFIQCKYNKIYNLQNLSVSCDN
nr:ABC transporter substrate-binding protein [Candidatus Gracilibacteria bacterium]